MLQCGKGKQAKNTRNSGWSVTVLNLYVFEKFQWNTSLLFIFISRRHVANSENQLWNVTVFQTDQSAEAWPFLPVLSTSNNWQVLMKEYLGKEKHFWRFQEPRRARCSVDIIYISQVQMFPWFLSTASQVTHIKWLLVLLASQENEEMTLGPLDLWWVQINHTIK